MKKRLIWILPVLVGLVIIVLLQTVFLLGYVPSESMEPTLREGSMIFGTRIYGELKNGDIIVFKYNEELFVKRIIAGPGEEINVDGKTYHVPPNAYFVLGDNSENSYDSRYWDDPFLNKEKIVAQILFALK